jgi:signal transduction histidine kinase
MRFSSESEGPSGGNMSAQASAALSAQASTAAAGPRNYSFQDDVKAELVRYLYRQAPGSQVAILIVGCVLTYVLWDIASRAQLIGWLLALAAVCALRLVQLSFFFRTDPPKERIGRWALASAAGSTLVGGAWAFACLLFLDAEQPISIITITVILMGICAGSIVNLASYLPSFWSVVGPSMGALIAVLLWHGGPVSNTVALLAAVASIAYFVGARNVNRLLTESLKLSFENVALRREAEEKSTLLEATLQDLKRREVALDAARRSAEQANAAKTRFLAAASHDLRQPMHALGLLMATLVEQVRNAQNAQLLGQIESAVDAVESMLNSLLDISKLDAGVVQANIGPVDLAALLERLNNDHQPIARLTGNELWVRPTEEVVLSDAAMLQRILANLVSNALRYTSNGRVLVSARARGDSLRIDVYDTGPGIPPESLEDIFVEFHQLGNPERDRRKGLGLGLAIVKRLASLLGHRIEVRSVVGRGSRFSVILPRSAKPRAVVEQRAVSAAPGAEVQGRRVLVLDDEVSVLNAMRHLLENWGCEVVTVATPEEAEAHVASNAAPVDLLIVDYRLRRHASGIATIARLRKLAGAPIPALVVTGDTAPDRLREAQASGYPLLHKPVTPTRLRAAMQELLPRQGALRVQ